MPALVPSFSDNVIPDSRHHSTSFRYAAIPASPPRVAHSARTRRRRDEARVEIEAVEHTAVGPGRGDHHGSARASADHRGRKKSVCVAHPPRGADARHTSSNGSGDVTLTHARLGPMFVNRQRADRPRHPIRGA